MKRSLIKIVTGVVGIACVFTMAACADEGDSGEKGNSGGNSGGNQEPKYTLAQQITLAENTYDAFYAKDEMFSSQSAKSAVALAASSAQADENNEVTFNDISNALSGYHWTTQDQKYLFNTYVADIFSYSQVQTSIINEFGEASLTDVYTLDYKNVDWSLDTTGFGSWVKNTKLLSATFVGADVDSGKVYCAQSHNSNGVLVTANLEYYYNDNGDMGVTTLNWHSDGTFEYHYCSAGTYEILQAFGTYNQSGNITLSQFVIYRQNSVLFNCSASDRTMVLDYVLSEISRINGNVGALQTQNGRERVLDGNESDGEEEHVGVCSVSIDFEILKRMLIK